MSKFRKRRRSRHPTFETPAPVVEVLGVQYQIDWPQVHVGSSFFLKTTATAKQVLAALKPHAGRYAAGLKAHERCEFGYYGVRVWYLG